jgi:hypothetical protein
VLQLLTCLFSVVISNDRVNGGLRSVFSSVYELFAWQLNGAFVDDTEGDPCVVALAEVAELGRSKLLFLDRHLVELLKVTGVRLVDSRGLVRMPFVDD